jgi:hypothetical protein
MAMPPAVPLLPPLAFGQEAIEEPGSVSDVWGADRELSAKAGCDASGTGGAGARAGRSVRRNGAILAVLQVEREALICLRDEGQIDDEVLRTLQRELDLEESRVHTGSLVVH